MLCLGYPTQEQKTKPLRPRFEESFIISQDRYRHFERPDFERLYRQTMEDLAKTGQPQASTAEFLWRVYQRKIGASFMIEMTRSVRAILHAWNDGTGS
ncbi:MAG: hypothetical protein A2V88_06705 [Elusimicrobia bacterium RBG_16_66_12]|nr:MAG: hypothetical protein A2V88_06705 [Elusimicrobia bacterium RBG_16_66_12]